MHPFAYMWLRPLVSTSPRREPTNHYYIHTNMIDPTKYTAHQHPGKFEGETAATEYYYELMLDGDGEGIYAPAASEDEDAYSNSATLFDINAEEAEAFDLPIGHWFMLREGSQGFVMGSSHESREAAEKAFAAWLGL
jgi:hypothetical protein